MKTKLKSYLLACTLGLSALTMSSLSTTEAHAATTLAVSSIESGFYFYNETGTGEFYNMTEWSKLDGNGKVSLFEKYPMESITIYLDTLDSWAKLSTLANQGKSFTQGSVDYKEGDIVGSYKDIANPSKDIEFATNEEFAVLGIE